jgi:hypothetical protein
MDMFILRISYLDCKRMYIVYGSSIHNYWTLEDCATKSPSFTDIILRIILKDNLKGSCRWTYGNDEAEIT